MDDKYPLKKWLKSSQFNGSVKLLAETIDVPGLHPDYLAEKKNPLSHLNCVVSLTAKEYVLINNPQASDVTITEEMNKLLIRARRHMPKQV